MIICMFLYVFVLFEGMGKGGDYEDEKFDVFQYFNSSCYTGFDDSDEVC